MSSGLTKIATLNRHIAPLNETHSNRSACGLAVIILTQSYKCQNGISRILRENLSLLTLFAKNSVIPKKFFFKKFLFDIGPLISPLQFFFFKISRPTWKQLDIYRFDLSEILSNIFLNKKSTLTMSATKTNTWNL